MDIRTDIEKQLLAGFSREDIYQRLAEKGYSKAEIDQQYTAVADDPAIRERHGGVSGKNILMGVLFLFIVIWRLSRIKEGHATSNTFLIIGVITAFVLAILYFTRRN